MPVERIAHRGAKREIHENTVPAFQRAFERGADAIELDVHATADGVVVVHHDPGVRQRLRTVEIAATTWSALHELELPDRTRVPRLVDVLAITPPGATVYVEIKGAGIERHVADALLDTRVRCAVHSFDHHAIELMRDLAPNLPRGILFERDISGVLDGMARTGARDVWPNWKLVDATLVQAIHDAGGRVIVWTVNDTALANRLVEMGVDGLCGDDVRSFDRG